MRCHLPVRLFVMVLLGIALSACHTAREPLRPEALGNLPDVPVQLGPLQITVVYPTPDQQRPSVDSTFVFGSVGTGDAALTINGEPVPVAANGGFLAFVRVPDDGTYHLEARANSLVESETFTYHVPPRHPPVVRAVMPPTWGRVRSLGRDTVDTGSQTAHATSTPNGNRVMFMLPETQVLVTGRVGDQVRVRLAEGREVWMPERDVELNHATAARTAPPVSFEFASTDSFVDIGFGAAQVPFVVESDGRRVAVTVYQVDGRSAPALDVDDGWIESAVVAAASQDSLRLEFNFARPFWGYKAFHEADSSLVIRLRKPPILESADSLSGLRILVDAGHPPAGATGPTRLSEAEANLRIALDVRDLLQQRGAEVLMTREEAAPMVSATNVADELWTRVGYAVEEDADILVSIHNNAFGDGVNPFRNHGSEVYYFHDFSQDLAQYLVDEIAAVTGIPNKGTFRRSLALARPSWMPAVLTESLYMMFPQQEAALRDPAFIRRLAVAHVRGIERFVEEKLR